MESAISQAARQLTESAQRFQHDLSRVPPGVPPSVHWLIEDAAPEMLEALEAIVADCGCSDYDEAMIVARSAVEKCKAAIRKAKGQADVS